MTPAKHRSEILDPEQENDKQPEPELPPEEEPLTAPEPETLPPDPDLMPPEDEAEGRAFARLPRGVR